ncbi:MAG: FAD-binding oxidoreductase [Chloroflexi bacterium]|nr:FAD-binding oxidoreductase [Chloroflexota bacterium]
MKPKTRPSSRVVIVGGGIIGCATAYYLTRVGVSDVTVVERDEIASGASGYSAGILTPYSGSNDPGLLALSAASLELHARLADELPEVTGIDHGYDLKPYLRCGFEEPGIDASQQFMADRIAEGLPAEWLSGSEAREVCDWLSDEVVGACATSIEPTVDSMLLTQSLLKAAQIGGAEVKIGTAVGFSGPEDAPNGVKLSDGTIVEADAIVLAMGPWTKEANDWLGYDIPVEPQKGELLYMHLPSDEAGGANVIPAHAGTPTAPGFPPLAGEMSIGQRGADQDKPPATMHNMDEGGVILTRRLSRTVLGATKEDGKGYDRETSDYAWEFILPRVQRLTDRITKDSVTHHTACLRPMPADGKPFVGKAPGRDNVYIASGHWSEGVHYAPLTGKAISDIVTTGESSTDIGAIDAARLAA